jgi:succinate dehydrogenase / fumarate reductase, cytochrome b subunit
VTQPASAGSISNPLLNATHRPYLWRKLFSLCGVIPIAAFTMFHLWENAKALQGRGEYVHMVEDIGRMPFLTALEIGMILIPICIHAVLGIKILLDARYNVGAYSYSGNWGYTLQRLTALLVLGFLVYHVWELRLQKAITGMDAGGFFDTLCRNMSATMGGVPVIALVYILGIGAVAFHLANGLWGFCFSWGITVSRRSQRLAAGIMGIFGVLVFVLGANTAVYFATGSKLFVPSEWFTPAKAQVEGCSGPGLAPAAAPAPATSTTPATH